MSERFSDHLRRPADPVWGAQHAHPFAPPAIATGAPALLEGEPTPPC